MNLEGYELQAEIGRGGMGVVYRARARDGRDVAVKLMTARTPGALARFERERQLLATLGEAAGFVPLLDARDTPHGPALVMPFLPGGTLRARLRKGPLSVEETLALGRTLARAMGRAHEQGIVHRDLKPENVLFDATGRPLIADLGIAKSFVGDGVALTVTHELMGTPNYMAPEQADHAKTAGPPADVFALGAILWECLAGRKAFEGNSAVEILSKRSQGSGPPPVASLRPDAPAWLVKVVERCLADDPAARFLDGTELARALEGGAGGAAPSRAPLVLALVLGVVLGGAAAGAAAWHLAARAARDEVLAQQTAEARRIPEATAPAAEWLRAVETALAHDEAQAALLLEKADALPARPFDPGLAAAWLDAGPEPTAALIALAKRLGKAPRAATAIAVHACERDPRGMRARRSEVVPLLRAGALDSLKTHATQPDEVATARRALIWARILAPREPLEEERNLLWRAGDSPRLDLVRAAHPWWWLGSNVYDFGRELRGPPVTGPATQATRSEDSLWPGRWVAFRQHADRNAATQRDLLLEAVLHHPEVYVYWARAGEFAHGVGRFDEAAALFTAANEVHPCSDALLGLGSAEIAAGRFAEARAAFEQAGPINGGWALNGVGLAQAATSTDEAGYQTALATLDRALAIDGGMNDAPLYLGIRRFVLEKLGRHDDAEAVRARAQQILGN